MGMFEKPQYLTAKDDGGYVQPGETFWLHNAKVDGTVQIAGQTRDQAKLLVSHTRDGEKSTVFSAGVAIVNQVRRMSNEDRASLPMEVRLDQIPSKHGNPSNVLTPASADPPGGVDDEDIPF